MQAPVAIGHRIVLGGAKLRQHGLIDEPVMQQLESAAAFAPLHTPSALSVIRFAQQHFAGLPQVVCFDTTFHAAMPDVARVLPIPQDLQCSTLRISWSFLQIDRASTRDFLAGVSHYRPSRNGASVTRCEIRKIHRHQHGTDPERRGHDGFAQWRSRSRCSGLSDARAEIRRGHAGRSDRSSVGPEGNFRNWRRYAASA